MDLIIIYSIPTPPHLPSSNLKQHMTDQTNSTIIRGRTANSKIRRYSKDYKPKRDGSQAWRCVKKDNVKADSGLRE